jgi:hypothetical protein
VAFVRYSGPDAGDIYTYDIGRERLTRVAEGVRWAQVDWADPRNLFVTRVLDEDRVELVLMGADGRGGEQLLLQPIGAIRAPDAVPGMLALEVTTRIANLRRFHRGRITSITDGNQSDSNADFSADGTLAFTSAQSRNWIYVQASGEAPRRLVEMTGSSPEGLRWSPDARRLVYVATQDGRRRLFVVDVASGVIRPLEAAGELEAGNPDWSPDGRSLVFTALSEGGPV